MELISNDLPKCSIATIGIKTDGGNMYDEFYKPRTDDRIKGPWCSYGCVNELASLSLNIAKWALSYKLVTRENYRELRENEMDFTELSLIDRVLFRAWVHKVQRGCV
jgi:hypothetical protein